LKEGAKVDIIDNDGWTAEAYAAYIGNIALADKVNPVGVIFVTCNR
jgi:polynucleotide 5'-kinase involved in rRNA processing